MLEEGMTGSAKFVKGPWRYERVEDSSHWIPLDQPELTTKLLTGFLGTEKPATMPTRRRRL